MFVQIVQGRTSDVGAVHAAVDRWAAGLSWPGTGFLGATVGVTDDGRVIGLARFESAGAARRTGDHARLAPWWTAPGVLDGDPVVVESEDVGLDLVGDPDTAGFVQVMQGRTTDRQRTKELMAADSPEWASFRPDILGSLNVDHGDGGWTSAIYFTSEAEAREGERKVPPPGLQAQMAEMEALEEGPLTYLDLREPWLYTPR